MTRRTIDIGQLNKRITFLELDSEATDDLGQLTNGFTEIGTFWGSLYPVRGQEFYEIQKIQGRVTHKCYVRYRDSLSDLSSNNYLRYGDKTYSIEGVMDIDLAHKFLEILCSEHINKEEIADLIPMASEEVAENGDG